MSSILNREQAETRASSTNTGERLGRAITLVRDRAGSDGIAGRAFLVVDLGVVGRYLLGKRGPATEAVEPRTEPVLDVPVERRSDERGGRGMLGMLFVLGAVVGVGYALRRRTGSGEDLGERADELADSVEAGSESVAEQVRERGEEAADRVEEAGDTAEEFQTEAEERVDEMTDDGDEDGGT